MKLSPYMNVLTAKFLHKRNFNIKNILDFLLKIYKINPSFPTNNATFMPKSKFQMPFISGFKTDESLPLYATALT